MRKRNSKSKCKNIQDQLGIKKYLTLEKKKQSKVNITLKTLSKNKLENIRVLEKHLIVLQTIKTTYLFAKILHDIEDSRISAAVGRV